MSYYVGGGYYGMKGDAAGFRTVAGAIGQAAESIPVFGKFVSAFRGITSLFGKHRRPCEPGEYYDMPCDKWPCYGCNAQVIAAHQAAQQDPELDYNGTGEQPLEAEYVDEGEEDAATEF